MTARTGQHPAGAPRWHRLAPPRPAGAVRAARRAAAVHDRLEHRERRGRADRPRAARQPDHRAVDGERLPARPRRRPGGHRVPGPPVRHPAGVPDQRPGLHRRLRAVRAGPGRRPAGRRASAAGPGRGAAGAAGHEHAPRAGQRGQPLDLPGGRDHAVPRPGARPHRGRGADRGGRLARHLPHQRAARRGGRGSGPVRPGRAGPGPHPGGPVRPARADPARGRPDRSAARGQPGRRVRLDLGRHPGPADRGRGAAGRLHRLGAAPRPARPGPVAGPPASARPVHRAFRAGLGGDLGRGVPAPGVRPVGAGPQRARRGPDPAPAGPHYRPVRRARPPAADPPHHPGHHTGRFRRPGRGQPRPVAGRRGHAPVADRDHPGRPLGLHRADHQPAAPSRDRTPAPRPARRREHPVQHLAADRRIVRNRLARRPVRDPSPRPRPRPRPPPDRHSAVRNRRRRRPIRPSPPPPSATPPSPATSRSPPRPGPAPPAPLAPSRSPRPARPVPLAPSRSPRPARPVPLAPSRSPRPARPVPLAPSRSLPPPARPAATPPHSPHQSHRQHFRG